MRRSCFWQIFPESLSRGEEMKRRKKFIKDKKQRGEWVESLFWPVPMNSASSLVSHGEIRAVSILSLVVRDTFRRFRSNAPPRGFATARATFARCAATATSVTRTAHSTFWPDTSFERSLVHRPRGQGLGMKTICLFTERNKARYEAYLEAWHLLWHLLAPAMGSKLTPAPRVAPSSCRAGDRSQGVVASFAQELRHHRAFINECRPERTVFH